LLLEKEKGNGYSKINIFYKVESIVGQVLSFPRVPQHQLNIQPSKTPFATEVIDSMQDFFIFFMRKNGGS